MDHLGLDGTAARRALITGDPGRVGPIAEHLGGGRPVSDRRGLLVWEASCAGEPLLVVASGIGAPATAIVVEELAEAGVHTVVRVGTCGAIAAGLEPGHLVLATGAVRDEGTSRQYIEAGFPAVPDLDLTAALAAQLAARDWPHRRGIVHSKDAYYLERAERQVSPSETGRRWQALRTAGVVATEMESSALFVLGSLRGLRTATLLVTVGRTTAPQLLAGALQAAVGAVAGAFAQVGPPAGGPRPLGPRRSFLESGGDAPGDPEP
ncbi:MAG TPA: hypothetical protein VHQ65_10225 [Thermoanaerobaculia bacterium]|nr:hypothetical protein [Thermoanaerobaculia bacterium]